MKKLTFIIGPTGSGKNYLYNNLKNYNYLNVPSITNRKKRDGEIEGEDYIFISELEFNELKDTNQLCEYIKFGLNQYGVSKNILKNYIEYKKENLVLIVEPKGLIQMLIWIQNELNFCKNFINEIELIYLDIPRIERFRNILFEESDKNNFDINELNIPNKIGLEIIEKVLDRLVRNGDSIQDCFIKLYDDIFDLFNKINEDIKCTYYKVENKQQLNLLINKFISTSKLRRYN